MNVDLPTLETELVVALKAREAVKAGTIRMLIARLKNERIAAGGELSADTLLRSVQSEYKRRKEAAAEYVRGGRQELADQELAEAIILEAYLPVQVTEAEIVAAFEELSTAQDLTVKDMGVVIKALKERFGATADGSLLAKIVKEKLTV
ncbi:MAG: GatB/YqeY domain-containing protein [Candidatus Doudnabacteria bacterium]|nr:GatB/YqeY domain-containing protein [Candidatus Doudnabacteria bacterium]